MYFWNLKYIKKLYVDIEHVMQSSNFDIIHYMKVLTTILLSASCWQTMATSLTYVGNLCCQWSMLADLLLNCTLSNIIVTALSSNFSTSPYKIGILRMAAPKRKERKAINVAQIKIHNTIAQHAINFTPIETMEKGQI